MAHHQKTIRLTGKRNSPLKAASPQEGSLSLRPEQLEIFTALRREHLDEGSRSVSVAFSSEAPLKDFAGVPPIVLLHEPAAVKLESLRGLGSVLYDHDPKSVVGRPEDVTLDVQARVARARVVFDTDQASELVYQKVRSGSLRGVSARYQAERGFTLRDGENWTSPGGKTFQGPAVIVTSWSPREISLTPIPADPSVGVGRSTSREDVMPQWLKDWLVKRSLVKEDATEEECRKALEGYKGDAPVPTEAKRSEPTTPPTPPTPPTPEPPVPERQDGRRQALELLTFARNAGMPERAPEWIEKGLTVDAVRHQVLDELIKRQPPVSTRVTVGEDATDKFFEAHEAVMLRRASRSMGGKLDLKSLKPEVGADIPPDLPLKEFIRRWLHQAGIPGVQGWSDNDLATRGLQMVANPVFSGQRALQHASADFPYLLENVAQKSLTAGFAEARTTYQDWCMSLSVGDFKSVSRAKLSEAEEFVVNPELMPIAESTVADARETYQIYTYARRFGISRIAVINDDLSGFARIPALFGAAAKRTMNKLFYTTWLANPTMAEDGQALFYAHSSGTNLGTAGAPSATTLAEARKLMRLQKGFNPKTPARLNITPTFIIAPVAHEHTILQLLQASFVPTAVTSVQPTWMSQLRLIVDPNLDDNSVNAWYLAASPSEIDTVAAIYLNGVQTPSLVRVDGTSILGLEWIAYFDFGAKALEWRGMFKNAGA